jgi:hypothetical protein
VEHGGESSTPPAIHRSSVAARLLLLAEMGTTPTGCESLVKWGLVLAMHDRHLQHLTYGGKIPLWF